MTLLATQRGVCQIMTVRCLPFHWGEASMRVGAAIIAHQPRTTGRNYRLATQISALACWVLAALLLTRSTACAQDLQLKGLLQGAQDQIGKTVRYDPSYQAIAFPGGDVPIDRGVCSDVIVRAYRKIGIDLQLLVNQDMRQNFGAYPHRLWMLSRADPNIDHRRVANLVVFFTRHGQALPISSEAPDYKPGDIVAWRIPDGRPHIGLVSDWQQNGRPLVIHNIGAGAQLEDVLFTFTITGHYRYLPEKGS
jgi:uncharacterized protein